MPTEETLNVLKEFVEKTKTSSDVLKQRWKDCSAIEDEKVRLIAIGVLQSEEVYNVHKKWAEYDLKKYGIEDFNAFWQDTILNNRDKVASEHDALTLLDRELQKKLRSKAQEFEGIIVSEGMKRDNFTKFINLVHDTYKADPEATIKSGYVQVYDNIEELREKYPELEKKLTDKYFIDNKIIIPIGKKDISLTLGDKKFKRTNWYGGRFDKKPVVGVAFMKSLLVIAKIKGKDDSYQKYDLVLNDEQCSVATPSCVHVKFLANVSPSNKGKLNPTSSGIAFNVIGDGEFDMSTVQTVLDKMLIGFNNIPDYLKNMTEDKRFLVKAVKAKVSEMPPTEGSRYMMLSETKERTLDDMTNLFDDKGEFHDASMHCTIPENIAINFGEGSEIVVFGTPKYGSSFVDGEWTEDKTKFSMWVSGIYVSKEHKVEIAHSVDVSDQELQEDFDKDSDGSKENTDNLDALNDIDK